MLLIMVLKIIFQISFYSLDESVFNLFVVFLLKKINFKGQIACPDISGELIKFFFHVTYMKFSRNFFMNVC